MVKTRKNCLEKEAGEAERVSAEETSPSLDAQDQSAPTTPPPSSTPPSTPPRSPPPSPTLTPPTPTSPAPTALPRPQEVNVKAKRKAIAIAKARLALAEARLAALEAEMSDDEPPEAKSPVISDNAAPNAEMSSPQLLHHDASHTNAQSTEARRERGAAVKSPVISDTAAPDPAMSSPQLLHHDASHTNAQSTEARRERGAAVKSPVISDTAAPDAAMISPQLLHHDASHTNAQSTEARRERGAAVKSPVISDTAAPDPAMISPQLLHHDASHTNVQLTEARRERGAAVETPPVISGTAAPIATMRSPQLTQTSDCHGVSESHMPGGFGRQQMTSPSFDAQRDDAPQPATPRRSDSDDASQTLKGLASALLEVARGGRPAANRYCFDLPNFNGAVSEWLHFKAAYEESAPTYTSNENLARLRKALKGTAMEAVKCLFLGSSPDVIIKKLECRFGRPHTLIIHEMEKLRHLQKLTDNPREVCTFASKVGNIIATVQALNKPEYLHSPELINIIVTDKLTTIMRNKWYEFESKSALEEPGLVTLGRFLDCEAELNARHAKAEQVEEPYCRASYDKQRTFAVREIGICKVCGGNCKTISNCINFNNMSIAERWEHARSNKLCFRCLQRRTWQHRCRSRQCEMEGCDYFHHKLLHGAGDRMRPRAEGATTHAQCEVSAHACACAVDHHITIGSSASHQCTTPQPLNVVPHPNFTPCCHHDAHAAVVTSTWTPQPSTRTLLKVIPVTISGPLGEMNTFALLDDGSTVTLMTTETAQRIGASGPNEPFYIEAVAGARINANSSQRVKFNIWGRYVDGSNSSEIKARTIDKLDISAQSIPKEALAGCDHLASVVDQLVYQVGVPTILIGQDNWPLLLVSEVLQGPKNQPVASRTPLGWVLHGQHSAYKTLEQTAHVVERCNHVSDRPLDQLIKEHFSLESLGVEQRRPKADPETRALQILEKTTRALPDRKGYETGLLWKSEGKPFPNNYSTALSRLIGVEKRLNKDPNLKGKYCDQIKSMVDNGYAELAPTAPPNGRTWYLPHFPVLNESKPGKVRIVHDAATRTHGVCLNDYLLTGPDLLNSLLGVLMRFRQKPVAVVADIKDMFLRITVREEDRDALRFLWREDSNSTPIEYRMRSVLFGATSSPSTAIYVKNYNAHLHESEYPEAVGPIIRNHYMDDYLQSFDDAEEANKVSRAVDEVHRRGNFVLQKWASNCPAAIAGLATEPAAADVCLSNEEKVLGLVWRPADDTLGFNFRKVDPFYLDKQITKRQLLKTAMSLYDPLGLVTPITSQAKRILQETWRYNVDWDDYLPKNLEHKWCEWLIALQNLKSVQIPRCHEGYSVAKTLELHVFVDASELCYAAAAYWRSIDETGNIRVSLAAAKGRAAPLSITSVPRLELQAAVLGGRLATTVEGEHDRRADRRVFWSDSRTVLAWLRAGARSFKPFVAHRVAELEDTTAAAEWRWVPTALNVADDATRDVSPDFDTNHRWFRGPSFLYDDEETWPREHEPVTVTETGEERVTATIATPGPRLIEALPDATRFSSWLRLVRTTARVLQFIERCRPHTTTATRKRTRRAVTEDPTWSATRPDTARARPSSSTRGRLTVAPIDYVSLPVQYTRNAELLWARATQEDCFAEELRDVTGGRPLSTTSRLRQLSLITDEYGVLRIRSRIAAAADVSEEALSPAVLDGNHYYCRLYIDWVHRRLHHSGVECVVNEVRQHYWILRLRPSVIGVIKCCQPCRLRRAVPPEPLTGDLPPCRLAHHQRAFTHTGLDYFGPLSVTVARHHEKRYVALFTCLTTRAVHLEIAASLSTDSVVLALRRMIARRGCPESIWSDNGTNFQGAAAELRKAAMTSLQEGAEIRNIEWHFICPRAPFMGGAWERLIRCVKAALTATLAERHPHEDVLHTLLTEIEHTVNSRPLSHVSVAPEDEEALTPNHFLLGGPSKVPLPGTFTKTDELGRSHWRASQRLADLFWQRWVREVLPVLQDRREPHGRGEPIKEGNVVVIVDSNLPRNVWPKGRVVRVYPGADGVVRVVDVRTKSGIMRRATKRLVILPVE